MLNAIAIDDEPVALEVIRRLSAQISFVNLAKCFTNAFHALDFLQSEKVDLIFLDIKMPDISGVDFLKSIVNPPMVIFTTAYSEHAVQSFELNAIDYLLKPFSQARFLQACNKASEQYMLRGGPDKPTTETIFIKSGYEQVKIQLSQIMYVESSGNYMQFVLTDNKILSRLTMSETEALLPANLFMRIHRCYLVAKKHITSVNKTSVWLQKTELPIGANYLPDILKGLK